MKFYQRFAYYIFGFILGMFFVAAVWSKQGVTCDYLPNARVLKDIRQKPFYYSPKSDSTFAQGWISKEEVKKILTYGDVDFSKSNIPAEHGKLYVVEGQTDKEIPVVIEVINYEDKAVLRSILKAPKSE